MSISFIWPWRRSPIVSPILDLAKARRNAVLSALQIRRVRKGEGPEFQVIGVSAYDDDSGSRSPTPKGEQVEALRVAARCVQMAGGRLARLRHRTSHKPELRFDRLFDLAGDRRTSLRVRAGLYFIWCFCWVHGGWPYPRRRSLREKSANSGARADPIDGHDLRQGQIRRPDSVFGRAAVSVDAALDSSSRHHLCVVLRPGTISTFGTHHPNAFYDSDRVDNADYRQCCRWLVRCVLLCGQRIFYPNAAERAHRCFYRYGIEYCAHLEQLADHAHLGSDRADTFSAQPRHLPRGPDCHISCAGTRDLARLSCRSRRGKAVTPA